jgi:hypothetical protein
MGLRSTLLLFVVTLCGLAGDGRQYFERNNGQAQREVQLYLANAKAGVQFKSTGVEFVARDGDERVERMLLRFAGATALRWEGREAAGGEVTYLLPEGQMEAQRFAKVVAADAYPGIDVVFYLKGGKLEYDFVVKPGADATKIRIAFDGRSVKGRHEFYSSFGGAPWVQRAPVSYQMRAGQQVAVASRWDRVAGGGFQLVTGDYDKRAALVVDPVIEFASYLSGEADDEVVAVGQGFVAGHTQSKMIDGVNGSLRKGRDLFVRFDPNATANWAANPLWRGRMIVIGGAEDDSLAYANVTGQSNAVYVTLAGTTKSRNLPLGGSMGYRGGASDGFAMVYALDTLRGFLSTRQTGEFIGGAGEDVILNATGFTTVWFAGRSDSTDLPVLKPIQALPGGMQDGFAGAINLLNDPQWVWLTYWGGAKDDELGAIEVNASNLVILGGTTSSETIAQVPGKLAGPSDGFVLWLDANVTSGNFSVTQWATLVGAQRVGGGGAERVARVDWAQGVTVVAGETSSPDLTVLRESQATLQGNTDAFVMAFNAKREPQFGTYLGGTGGETVGDLQVGPAGIYVAGSTTSADLVLQGPIQDGLKGGMDGYVALLGLEGGLQFATYYGGNGEDKILALQAVADQPLLIGGATTSTDLPEVGNWPATERGGWDGFVARIGLPYLTVPKLIYTTKAANGTLRLTTARTYGLGVIQVRVADEGLVRLVAGVQAGKQVAVPTGYTVEFEAVAERGQTDVEFVSDGVVVARTQVRIGVLETRLETAPKRISGFMRRFSLQMQLVVVDEETGTVALATAHGISVPSGEFFWKSSNPNVMRVSRVDFREAQFEVIGRGVTNIAVESILPFFPEGGVPIEVDRGRLMVLGGVPYANPLVSTDLVLSPDADALGGTGAIAGEIEVISETPQLLQVQGVSGVFESQAVYSIVGFAGANPASLRVPLRALASEGTGRLRIHSDQMEEDLVVEVPLEKLLIQVEARNRAQGASQAPGLDVLRVGPGEGVMLVAKAYWPQTRVPLTSAPSNNLALDIESSNAAVVRADRANSEYGMLASVPLVAQQEGDAMIRISTANPHARVIAAPRVQVRAQRLQPLTPGPIYLGRKLQRSVSGLFGIPTGVNLQATVANPEIVGLAALVGSATVGALEFNTAAPPFLRAVAMSGSTTLKIEAPGMPPLEMRIEVVPSGFAFDVEQLTLSLGQPQGIGFTPSYALDPETLEPIEAQQIQWDYRVAPRFGTADAALQLANCPTSTPTLSFVVNCSVYITVTGAGAGVVELQPVEGFDVASSRQRLRVSLAQPSATTSPNVAVKDAYVQHAIVWPETGNGRPTAVNVQVTSLTPDVLQLATSSTGTPVNSIQVSSVNGFYVVGNGGEGIGRIRIEGQAVPSMEVAIVPQPMTIWIDRLNPTGQQNDQLVPGQVLSYRVRLGGKYGAAIQGLKAGVGELPFQLESSKPDVAQVTPSGAGSFSATNLTRNFTVRGVSPGDARIVPKLRGASGADMAVRVGGGGWTMPSLMLPNQMSMVARMQPNSLVSTLPVATELTIRSLDPGKLLVRGANQTEAGESIKIVAPAGATASVAFELVGLAAEGSTEIEIAVTGGETTWARIYHTALALAFAGVSPSNYYPGGRYTFPLQLLPMPRMDLPGGGLVMMQNAIFNNDFDRSAIPIDIETDNPEMISFEAPWPRFGNGGDGRPLTIGIRSVGKAMIGFKQGGFPGERGKLRIEAKLPKLDVSCPQVVFYQSINGCLIRGEFTRIPYRIRSLNGAQLLLSEGETVANSSDLTVSGIGGARFMVHSLVSAGTSKIVVSASNYADTEIELTHLRSAFYLEPGEASLAVGQTTNLEVKLIGVRADGTAETAIRYGSYRPGAPQVTFGMRVSDASVIQLGTAPVVYTVQDQRGTVTVRAVKVGTAELELLTPPGFAPSPFGSAKVTVRAN